MKYRAKARLEPAILAMFDSEARSVKRNGSVLTRKLLCQYCHSWQKADHTLREMTLKQMLADGLLVAEGNGFTRGPTIYRAPPPPPPPDSPESIWARAVSAYQRGETYVFSPAEITILESDIATNGHADIASIKALLS